ncbi:hypothetical protein Val02_69920 [Virgisporangium aliadipatigenens]|uniref:Uncharacterized protein n=1 Tax=Virgisporangium aliadipatigenens TaxID=741659 RepID=A0A8J3YUM5_9ACTN|nr:hypothetical protein [Virgisporangium aliadipatigenens]GIJ50106.1 hypothetical protein Val02_69920 [Virgisporangium aliadipatigenens]
MGKRWVPVAVLAGVLFGVNVIGRVAAKLFAEKDDDKQITIGLVALGVIGVIVLGMAVRWTQRYPMNRVWGTLGGAVLAACAASVLIGPLLVGETPFAEGAGLFFRQIWWYLGMSLAAGAFGALAVMTFGKDWKSQAWKRYAEQANAKPRKVVRR